MENKSSSYPKFFWFSGASIGPGFSFFKLLDVFLILAAMNAPVGGMNMAGACEEQTNI
ncbi:MAG: hypothetical protein IPF68_07010 [Bacteroidales bacterium]|nr:hypothetical protein [Bacteroidales bacterium]